MFLYLLCLLGIPHPNHVFIEIDNLRVYSEDLLYGLNFMFDLALIFGRNERGQISRFPFMVSMQIGCSGVFGGSYGCVGIIVTISEQKIYWMQVIGYSHYRY